MRSELELRTCGKAGCRWPASASLSFRYETRQVWLLGLASEPDPSLYDLCPHHADTLTVPRGWERVDQREHTEAVREPAGADLHAPPPPRPERHAHGNRYAAIAAELPRLARQYGAVLTDEPPTVRDPAGSGADDDLPGQLSIPVEDEGGGAIIVSIEEAGARRRGDPDGPSPA